MYNNEINNLDNYFLKSSFLINLRDTILKNRLPEDEFIRLPNITKFGYQSNNMLLNILNDRFLDSIDISLLKYIPDINNASNIIKQAIINNDLIVCAVDIDCDGILSGYVLYEYLTESFNIKKENIKMVIGTRSAGRGINNYILDRIYTIENKLNRKVNLLITADHGTTDENNYNILKQHNKNIKIILTDHHTIEKDNYPKSADAFINPHRIKNVLKEYEAMYKIKNDEINKTNYEKCLNTYEWFKDMSGCGTVFLFLFYTNSVLNKDTTIAKRLLHFVGITTIVDMMPMNNIFNRGLVLNLLYNNDKIEDRNLNNIKKILKINYNLFQKDINVYIGPYINTANRLGAERLTLGALLTDNDNLSKENLVYLNELNKKRKLDTAIAVNKILTNPDTYKYTDGITCFNDTKSLVNGIIASNISSMYQKPTVCFNSVITDGKYNGSGRAGSDYINLLAILKKIKSDYPDVVADAAGHKGACGCSIYADKINDFKYLFDAYSKEFNKDIKIPEIQEEFTLEQNELNISTAAEIMYCGPYGVKWREPIIRTNSLIVKNLTSIKNFWKLEFILQDGTTIEGMHFFKVQSKIGITTVNIKTIIKPNMLVDVLYNINISKYNPNKSYIQLEIIDIIPHKDDI